jgi:hypothetical protein
MVWSSHRCVPLGFVPTLAFCEMYPRPSIISKVDPSVTNTTTETGERNIWLVSSHRQILLPPKREMRNIFLKDSRYSYASTNSRELRFRANGTFRTPKYLFEQNHSGPLRANHSEPTHRLIRNTIIMSAADESWSSDREDVEVGSTRTQLHPKFANDEDDVDDETCHGKSNSYKRKSQVEKDDNNVSPTK